MVYEMVRASGDPLGYRGWVGNDIRPARAFVYHENAVLPLGPDDGTVDHLLIVSLLVPRRAESGQMRAAPRWKRCLLAALAGCAAVTAPPGGAPTAPMIADDSFTADDGLSLPLRHWGPHGSSPRHHHRRAAWHERLFQCLRHAGPQLGRGRAFSLSAYDQRGLGAGPNPGLWAGSDRMRSDLGERHRPPRMHAGRACQSMPWAKAWGPRWC